VERTTIAGETEVLGENLPQRHFLPPQIPHDQVQFRTPDRSGGEPATNRVSYGAALLRRLVAGFPPRWPVFDPMSSRMVFIVDRMPLDTHISSGAGAMGLLLAYVPS
jgi:hypothetical protein